MQASGNRTRRRLFRLFWIAVVVSLFFEQSLMADSFHNGGVGACDGCHSMHGYEDGVPLPGAGLSAALLRAADASSICLNCHAGMGATTGPNILSPDGSAMTPGGDFYWLNKTFTWVGGSVPGYRHGHNVNAQSYGLGPDVLNAVSPMGTYDATRLGCTSCHDPHGSGTGQTGSVVSGSGSYGDVPVAGTQLGTYRLLGGAGYDADGSGGGFTFNQGTPVARQSAVSRYGESNTSHVDYGSSMSEWCGNCHDQALFNDHNNGSGFEHPSGNNEGLDDTVDTYNQYVRTGDLSGVQATAYLALVPFERGVTDSSLLDPASTTGPDQNSNIMCLTCHRAHASAFLYAGRWDFEAETIATSHPALGDVGVAGSDIFYAWYARDMVAEFGIGQRSLCEKCHTVPRDGYPPGW